MYDSNIAVNFQNASFFFSIGNDSECAAILHPCIDVGCVNCVVLDEALQKNMGHFEHHPVERLVRTSRNRAFDENNLETRRDAWPARS